VLAALVAWDGQLPLRRLLPERLHEEADAMRSGGALLRQRRLLHQTSAVRAGGALRRQGRLLPQTAAVPAVPTAEPLLAMRYSREFVSGLREASVTRVMAPTALSLFCGKTYRG
jgi:hypothetical protein